MERDWGWVEDAEYEGEVNLWENGSILGWIDLRTPADITWHDIRGWGAVIKGLQGLSEDEAKAVVEAMIRLEG